MSLFSSLRSLGRPIVVHRRVAAAFGILEGQFLEQLAYWMERTEEDAEGWVYKTSQDIEREIGLTYRQQGRIRESLVKAGVLMERYDRSEHVIFFKVNEQKFDELVCGAPDETSDAHLTKGQVAPDERSGGTLPNVSSYKGSREYAESTTEITVESGASAPPHEPTAWEKYQAEKSAKKDKKKNRGIGRKLSVGRTEHQRTEVTRFESPAERNQRGVDAIRDAIIRGVG